MTWLEFVIATMAIVSLTRFVVKDEFPPMRWVRDAILDTFGVFDGEGNLTGGRGRAAASKGIAHSIAYLFTCPWCMSFWVGVGVANYLLVATDIPPWQLIALIFAARIAAGWLAMLEELLEQRRAEAARRLESQLT